MTDDNRTTGDQTKHIYDPITIDFKGITDKPSRELISLAYLLIQINQTLPGEMAAMPGLIGVSILQVRDGLLKTTPADKFDGGKFTMAAMLVIQELIQLEADSVEESGTPTDGDHYNVMVLTLASTVVHGIWGQLEAMAVDGARTLAMVKSMHDMMLRVFKASQN